MLLEKKEDKDLIRNYYFVYCMTFFLFTFRERSS